MTREEFESILEAAFNVGYEDAELDVYDEGKRLTDDDKKWVKNKVNELPQSNNPIMQRLKSHGVKSLVAYKRYMRYLKDANDIDPDKEKKMEDTFIRKTAKNLHHTKKIANILKRIDDGRTYNIY